MLSLLPLNIGRALGGLEKKGSKVLNWKCIHTELSGRQRGFVLGLGRIALGAPEGKSRKTDGRKLIQ